MTEQERQQLIETLMENPQSLRKLSHAQLYQARAGAPNYMQDILSGPEHAAFAREATAENPLMALPIAAGAVAYQPYKMVKGSRSKPSLDQVIDALIGVKDGLKQAWER